ncbi:MAG: alpha-amylase family glycosyl hydrolase [Acidimicrobiales bacterium]
MDAPGASQAIPADEAGRPVVEPGGSTAAVQPPVAPLTVVPAATYRLQLGPDLGFDEAAALAPYLAALGASHAYLSPILQAAPGSTHGYDVVDHGRLSAELGGDDGYRRLCGELRSHGLGQVVDVVPNHMAAVPENRWWWDVLENGPSSLEAHRFDIDWAAEPRGTDLRSRPVLVPVLGDHYGRVVDRGEVQLVRAGGRFEVRYFEHRFPLAPARSMACCAVPPPGCRPPIRTARPPRLLRRCLRRPAAVAAHGPSRHRPPPPRQGGAGRAVGRRPRRPRPAGRGRRRRAGRRHHGPRRPRRGARPPELPTRPLAGRCLRLDYRRFFDITTLVGLRMDDPDTFERTHALLLSLVEQGCIDGLRIDHPDGLRDPAGYFEGLARRAPGRWIVAEKILARGEPLPPWPIAGTTGYDFAAVAGGVLLDPAGEAPLTETAPRPHRRRTQLVRPRAGGQA